MDYSLLSHESFIDKKVTELPTPALVLSKPVLERNTQQVLDDVQALKIAFRPHVKTLKVCNTWQRRKRCPCLIYKSLQRSPA